MEKLDFYKNAHYHSLLAACIQQLYTLLHIHMYAYVGYKL